MTNIYAMTFKSPARCIPSNLWRAILNKAAAQPQWDWSPRGTSWAKAAKDIQRLPCRQWRAR